MIYLVVSVVNPVVLPDNHQRIMYYALLFGESLWQMCIAQLYKFLQNI